MVKIKWIITDPINDVDLNEFDTEWNGIYGYFEICINNHVLGFCPDRELLAGEEGNEDILYWLTKLSDGIIQLNVGKEYEIQLLSMNMAKIILKKNDKLLISFVNTNTDEVIWSEKMTIKEWCNEIILNIERFIKEVQNNNSILLKTNLIQKLVKIKETLV
ncbi:MAG: hypothetical protein IIT46_06545 [Lachnospiraceae bacterium]|nr:hypothetical protein [Lachnospiraceae bacterium]